MGDNHSNFDIKGGGSAKNNQCNQLTINREIISYSNPHDFQGGLTPSCNTTIPIQVHLYYVEQYLFLFINTSYLCCGVVSASISSGELLDGLASQLRNIQYWYRVCM